MEQHQVCRVPGGDRVIGVWLRQPEHTRGSGQALTTARFPGTQHPVCSEAVMGRVPPWDSRAACAGGAGGSAGERSKHGAPEGRAGRGAGDSKGRERVLYKRSPCPSPCVAQALSVWQTARFLEEVLSPAQNTSLPVPTASLATRGKFFTLILSQVATNYPLSVLPGALCKTPGARCSEMQDARGQRMAPARCPADRAASPGRAWITQRFVCPALPSPLFSLSSLAEAFIPVQPCSAQLL